MPIIWARTFPDTPRKHDFTAHQDDELVGRIYRMGGGPQDGRWLWFANGIQASAGAVSCELNGEVATKQATADAVKALKASGCAIKGNISHKGDRICQPPGKSIHPRPVQEADVLSLAFLAFG